MSRHKRHKAVRESYLRRGLAEVFTPGRHYPTYLSEKVTQFSKHRGEDLCRLQTEAIHRLHNDPVFDLRDSDRTEFSDSAVLTAYFQFFDELFFFGSLAGSERCLLRFKAQRGNERQTRGMFFKYVQEGADGSQVQMFDIVMHKPYTYRQREPNRHVRLKSALCCLLQGMCHAFLGLWQCRTGTCQQTWGARGAGYAWQDMALAIEEALADRHFLNLRISLERRDMLIQMLKANPGRIKDAYLKDWGFDSRDLARYMKK
ncbi:hypothetical protein LZ554_005933 [Drepanopeziza brunnea f. sp. 'monogermtubi']|nr:hypothetical protein LZ554_005933 [Drepanopeziza brunnea f. sp. 'monogermtubi']